MTSRLGGAMTGIFGYIGGWFGRWIGDSVSKVSQSSIGLKAI
jgi:hypothetical protein